ncbi:MAG: CsgG/HfaB family protein [Treponema sp.]|nr:CsgG/HfaB family protein [Treponema sp.]
MKKLMMIFLAILAMVAAFAETTPKRMAVATFDVAGNAVTKEEAEAVTELYISELVSTGKVSVVDRANFDKLLAEMKFQASDWSDKEKTSKLGQAANADVIARGQILKLGSKLYLSATAVDVKTAVILSSSRKPFNSIDEIFNLLAPLAQEVVKGVTKKTMKYEIGDTGPGGGIVFYVSEEGFDVFDGKGGVQKCNYLEVSKVEIGKMTWCTCKESPWCTPNCGPGIGYGKSNTYRIMQTSHSGGSVYESNCAACACYNYSTPTTKQGEWFLPSKDELKLIYENCSAKVRCGASGVYYWTSTFGDYRFDFDDGRVEGRRGGGIYPVGTNMFINPTDICCVRAVRAFTD